MNVVHVSSRPNKNTHIIFFVDQLLFIFSSTKGFGVSMVTFSIGPSRASINMLFNGQETIPPQVANNAFIYAHTFKHITTLAHPLPSC